MQKACSLGRHQFTRVRVQHSKISHKGQLYVEKKREHNPRICKTGFVCETLARIWITCLKLDDNKIKA